MPIGYVFVTSDVPPETEGYSAPIQVLVGMDRQGQIVAIDVLSYRESLRSSRGDFLHRGPFLGQFPGKSVRDPFRLRTDLDGIAGASITSDATARGIRNAARRVAAAYLNAPPDAAPSYIATIPLEELSNLLWAEMVDRRLVAQVDLVEGRTPMTLFMTYLREPAVGEMMVGASMFAAGLDSIGGIGTREDDHLMMMSLIGDGAFFFRPSQLSFVQDPDTLRVPFEDLTMLPLLTEGKLQGENRRTGLLWVDGSLDLSRPFEVRLDMAPNEGVAAGIYVVAPPTTLALAPGSEVAGDAGVQAATPDAAGAADAPTVALADPAAAAGPAGAAEPLAQEFDFDELLLEEELEEQSALQMMMERTSWPRVAALVVFLLIVSWAFAAKKENLRLATLLLTALWLGWIDGGFLSVSHITAGISVGPEVYLGDLPLLILVAFTVVTTLLWGRVFCGFLCPFGALQDFIAKIVPERFQRDLPQAVHDKALWVKYGILAIVVTPAIVGSSLSLFGYFEPFGTVFYWSTSVVLWLIAGGFLVASAIIPRFYCRYACPLGASLAIASLVSPFRIKRVEQCNLCKVCQHACPTGAIRGPAIDFKECVRCNTCETLLIEKAGVCKHDMAGIRARLVKLPMAGSHGKGGVRLAGGGSA
jgi:ferredoxin